jgi:hypothetical protein
MLTRFLRHRKPEEASTSSTTPTPWKTVWDEELSKVPRREIQFTKTARQTKAIALSCIDFRLIDEVVAFLELHLSQDHDVTKFQDDFDYFILPGASLGVTCCVGRPEYEVWKDAFVSVLKASKRLHDVQELIIIDHMDCGQYRNIYSPGVTIPVDHEKDLHGENFRKFDIWYQDLKSKLEPFEIPQTVYYFLLHVDEEISTEGQAEGEEKVQQYMKVEQYDCSIAQ